MTLGKTLLMGLAATTALGLGIVWSTSSNAGTEAVKPAAAAPPTGRLLAGNCFQCHGTDGKGGPFEGIAGESASELYDEVKELQSGSGIMSVHARSYSDAQLRSIADYFSTVR